MLATHRRRSSPVAVTARRSQRPGMAGGAALVAGVVACVGLSASPATGATASRAPSAAQLVPGTVFVANGGSAGQGTGTGAGSVTLYRPRTSGNTRPETALSRGRC